MLKLFDGLQRGFLVDSLIDLKSVADNISSDLKKGCFLLIFGDLGVGKTTLSKMICQNLSPSSSVSSPTFDLLKRYWSKSYGCYINHFDFFRLGSADKLPSSIFDEFVFDSINIVEWPDNFQQMWETSNLMIRVSIEIVGESSRKITVESS